MAMCPRTNQPEQDIVYTPEYLAKEIIEHYNPKGRVLEPCRGGGAFYNQLPDDVEKLWCEIQEGVDFFEFKEKVDWVITNPPWSILRKFTQHCFDIEVENIVFLFNFNALMTKARLRDMRNAGYWIKEIYMVSTPKENWPQAGFQLGAVHIKKGYTGATEFTGTIG